MGFTKFLFFFVFFFNFSTIIYSQKIVAFDKRGKVKRVKYYEGEFIRLKTSNKKVVEGVITQIRSASFLINNQEVMLDSVVKVYNTQKLYGINLMGSFFIVAGSGYFPLDTFNRIINNDDPLVSEESALVSASFLSAGFICKAIAHKGYKISEKRPLKIIDLTI